MQNYFIRGVMRCIHISQVAQSIPLPHLPETQFKCGSSWMEQSISTQATERMEEHLSGAHNQSMVEPQSQQEVFYVQRCDLELIEQDKRAIQHREGIERRYEQRLKQLNLDFLQCRSDLGRLMSVTNGLNQEVTELKGNNESQAALITKLQEKVQQAESKCASLQKERDKSSYRLFRLKMTESDMKQRLTQSEALVLEEKENSRRLQEKNDQQQRNHQKTVKQVKINYQNLLATMNANHSEEMKDLKAEKQRYADPKIEELEKQLTYYKKNHLKREEELLETIKHLQRCLIDAKHLERSLQNEVTCYQELVEGQRQVLSSLEERKQEARKAESSREISRLSQSQDHHMMSAGSIVTRITPSHQVSSTTPNPNQ